MSEPNERTDHSIWPSLSCDDAPAMRAWLQRLGFEPGIEVPDERPGLIRHSELLWPEGGRVMVCSRGKSDPTFETAGVVSIYVVTSEPDAIQARAEELGAQFVRRIQETDYGSRDFAVRDPEANLWCFGTYAG